MNTIAPLQVQVFLIDENETHREKYTRSLNAHKNTLCKGFASVEDGLSGLADEQPDMVVLAHGMLTNSHTDLLQQIRDHNPFIDVVLLPGPSYADAMEKLSQLSGYTYRRCKSADYILDYLLTILARTRRSKGFA